MAFERRRGSALELVAIPCTKLQGGVSGGHHRETMGDEGCREKGGAEKGGCKPREGILFFWREVCYSSPLMLGKRREDTAKAVHAQRPTTKRRRQGSLSSF